MAQSGSTKKTPAEAPRPAGLAALRSQIDRIDKELVGQIALGVDGIKEVQNGIEVKAGNLS